MKRLPDPAPDTPTLEQLRTAFEAAGPETQGRWGSMTCPQMVRHCREFIDLYLGRVPVALPIRLLARLLGPVFLRRTLAKSPTATPRNLKTLPGIRADEALTLDFEAEKAQLLAGLEEVAALSGLLEHPLYGQMDSRDAVSLVRHHTAHHANQFGLLVLSSPGSSC